MADRDMSAGRGGEGGGGREISRCSPQRDPSRSARAETAKKNPLGAAGAVNSRACFPEIVWVAQSAMHCGKQNGDPHGSYVHNVDICGVFVIAF